VELRWPAGRPAASDHDEQLIMLTHSLAGPIMLVAASIATFAGGARALARQRRLQGNAGVHGTARFREEREIRTSGLLVSRQPAGASGVYLGGWRDGRGRTHYLRDISNGHVAICGPTRSGKGVCVIVTTLVDWRGSAIVYDEKGELWALTAGFRHHGAGNRVIRWEPGAVTGSAGFNFLAAIRLGTPHETADAQNIALHLVDPNGTGLDKLDHWSKVSFQVLPGVILDTACQAFHEHRTASMADVATALSQMGAEDVSLWEEMADNHHLPGGAPHPIVAAAGRAQLARSERERASALSTMQTHVLLFMDPIIRGNTDHGDFTLEDLADAEQPASVYIVTRGADATRLRPLVRLFLTMAMRHLMGPELVFENGQPLPAHRHKMLLMLDEFPSLGKMELIEASLARCAGYGVKVVIAIQDLSQLTGTYGPAQSIIANCQIKSCFPPNDLATAEWLSRNTGTTTVLAPHITASGKRFGALSQITKTFHETSRPVLTADECMTMPVAEKDAQGRIVAPGEMLIFELGQRAIRATQLLYFADPEFARRAALPPPDHAERAAAQTAR
jgi:type IV secretion system protein VirD4